jgi:23S rRNA (cytosine1962-C5)-methyltransferase
MKNSTILITEPGAEYELVDSGDGEKLERFGKFVLSRPDPQALWAKRLQPQEWKKADGTFTRDEKKGDWTLKKDLPDRWEISLGGLKLFVKPTAFKHVGLFPEHAPNWQWLRETIGPAAKSNPDLEALNLFGYTGAASLACAEAGAKVVHVDGSKVALTWGRENAELSGLKDKPIRWILDDARAFVKREIKRGRLYDGIIMDPPAFGHGPDNELWKIEEHFLPLIHDCLNLLKPEPLFFLLNGYSSGYSAVSYENNLLPLVKKSGGKIEIGELTIKESGIMNHESGISTQAGGQESRLLPAGIFARWSR